MARSASDGGVPTRACPALRGLAGPSSSYAIHVLACMTNPLLPSTRPDGHHDALAILAALPGLGGTIYRRFNGMMETVRRSPQRCLDEGVRVLPHLHETNCVNFMTQMTSLFLLKCRAARPGLRDRRLCSVGGSDRRAFAIGASVDCWSTHAPRSDARGSSGGRRSSSASGCGFSSFRPGGGGPRLPVMAIWARPGSPSPSAVESHRRITSATYCGDRRVGDRLGTGVPSFSIHAAHRLCAMGLAVLIVGAMHHIAGRQTPDPALAPPPRLAATT